MTVGTEAFDVPAMLARLGAHPRRISSDSRRVGDGVAFAAFPGARSDGRAFIPDAIARGASAVLWEARGFKWDAALAGPNQPVEHLRERLGPIADFIYGSPSKALWTIGVTGTNGKTSCTQWLAQAFERLGRRSAVIGTLGSGLAGALVPGAHTTPDAALLQETLALLRDQGARVVAMEVSSIGLEQGRVNGTHFDVALFTNLSRDHLDYHGTMAAYGAAKARLFAWPGLSAAVINADDGFGSGLAEDVRRRGQRTLTYGVSHGDVTARALDLSPRGMRIEIGTPQGNGTLSTTLVGTFNASNLLGTLAVLLASDVPLQDALGAMAGLVAPPGRMERFGGQGKPLVVVDYAHTPDALENVLASLRAGMPRGASLNVVFGCGGDRDPGKRPQMGRIAATLADRIVVTSDNPRSEDPAAIALAIGAGVRAAGDKAWAMEIDRAKAIQGAILAAREDDIVVIAGKGHEDYQEVAGEKRPFRDADQVTQALAQWSRA